MDSWGDGKKLSFLFKVFEQVSWIMQTQSQGIITPGSFSLVSYLSSEKYHPFGNSTWYFA